jgi:hypothetical protein
MDKAVHRLDVDRHQNRFNSYVGWMVHTGSQPGRATAASMRALRSRKAPGAFALALDVRLESSAITLPTKSRSGVRSGCQPLAGWDSTSSCWARRVLALQRGERYLHFEGRCVI